MSAVFKRQKRIIKIRKTYIYGRIVNKDGHSVSAHHF